MNERPVLIGQLSMPPALVAGATMRMLSSFESDGIGFRRMFFFLRMETHVDVKIEIAM